MTYRKKLLFWIAGIAVAIQFVRPEFDDSKADAAVALHANGQAAVILENACYDCHSDKTRLPWYSNIAPVSWFIANHIHDGRKAINFSRWRAIDPGTRIARLKRAKHLVEIGLMPLGSYRLMHKKANLTKQQAQTLVHFFDEQLKTLNASQNTAKERSLKNTQMG